MDEKVQISLDKLPVKRLESIEEKGAEQFPSYGSYFSPSFALLFSILPNRKN